MWIITTTQQRGALVDQKNKEHLEVHEMWKKIHFSVSEGVALCLQ